MIYVEAPNNWNGSPRPRVFCAGGITNCPDWQLELSSYLSSHQGPHEFTFLNPRRQNFPIDDPTASRAQIEWEYKALADSNVIVFWFARGSDNPIVMYEYGVHLTRLQIEQPPLGQLVVGCDPEYSRKNDVFIQTELKMPRLQINRDFDSFCKRVAFAISQG